jgi:cyclic pyranopterin phosphate synthase
MDRVVSRAEMLEVIARRYGTVVPVAEESTAPADRFVLPDGYVFGIISSTTQPFCRACDRSRLTADGLWYLCLYATQGTDLRRALRSGATREEMQHLIVATWRQRAARGAEERRAMADRRAPLVQVGELKRDPHLEMHTRGG